MKTRVQTNPNRRRLQKTNSGVTKVNNAMEVAVFCFIKYALSPVSFTNFKIIQTIIDQVFSQTQKNIFYCSVNLYVIFWAAILFLKYEIIFLLN